MSSATGNTGQILKARPSIKARIRSKPTLPVELLLVIFDMLIEDSFRVQELCDYVTFPAILRQLRLSWERPRYVHPWLQNLRLACRTFRAILISPNCFMKDINTAIPTTARALHINDAANAHLCLNVLVSEPSRAHRMIKLDILACDYSNHYRLDLQPFDALCTLSDFLPNIRSLTLGLRNSSSRIVTPHFWERLNNAFPYLVCLVFRGWVLTTYEDPIVEFQYLEILDVDHTQLDETLHFPALRHAAFGYISSPNTMKFTAWSQLESLLLREINKSVVSMEWDWFPKLKLLGIPGRKGTLFRHLPRWHPLHHLHLCVTGSMDSGSLDGGLYNFPLVRGLVGRFPTITRISVGSLLNWSIPAMGFTEHNANSIGFTLKQSPSSAQASQGYMVLERKPVSTTISPVVQPIPRESIHANPTTKSALPVPAPISPVIPPIPRESVHTNPIARAALPAPALISPVIQPIPRESIHANPIARSALPSPNPISPVIQSIPRDSIHANPITRSPLPAPTYTSPIDASTSQAPTHTYPPVQPKRQARDTGLWTKILRVILCRGLPEDT